MRLEVQYKSDSGSSARADSSPDIVVVGNNFQMTYRTVIPWSLSGERSIVVKFHPVSATLMMYGLMYTAIQSVKVYEKHVFNL